MGDESNGRPLKRARTRATASQSQAPSRSGPGADSAFDPALTGLIAPAEEDILVLYDTVLWPASFSFMQILLLAPLPSPFSLSIFEWLNTTWGDPLGSIRDLYDLVFVNSSELHEELAKKYPTFGSDGQLSGFLCWAEDTLPNSGVDEGLIKLTGNWVDKLGSNSLQLDLRKEPGQSEADWTLNLKIYGLKKNQAYVSSGGTEYNFFIVNDFEQRFSINGVPIAKGTVAGPLPDFAIIDIDGFFALWWGAQAGVDYVPTRITEVQGTKRSYDAFQEFENLNDNDRPIRRARILEEVPEIDFNLETMDYLQNPTFDPTFFPLTGDFVADQPGDSSLLPPIPPFDENFVFDQPQSEDLSSQFPSVNESFVLSQPQDESLNSSFPSFNASFDVDQPDSQGLIPQFPSFAGDFESKTTEEPGISDELTWCAEYNRRFRECTERPIQAVVPQCQSVRHLSFNDVVLAIASIWRGCAAKSTWFAFSNDELFDKARYRRIEDTRCVQPEQPFIIPLLLNFDTAILDPETQSNKEPSPPVSLATEWNMLGRLNNFRFPQNFDPAEFDKAGEGLKITLIDHIILVIAQLSDSKDVQLTFFDSCEGRQDKDVIRRAARNVVRNSAWLLDTWPNFTEETWEYPPQTMDTTCALHTILNAWAFMLGIRLNADRSKAFKRDFHQQALMLVNLALGGRLDGWTIRAFFQCYGYAQPEAHATVVIQDILQDVENQGIMRARSHPMTKLLLNSILQGVYSVDKKPVGHVVPSVQPPSSGTQRVLRSQKVQPGLEGQPIPVSQPVLGGQPVPRYQPIPGAQPVPESQSGLGGQPVLESQPDRQRPSRKQPSRQPKSRKQSGQELQPSPSLDVQPDFEDQPVQTDQPKRKGKAGRKPKQPPTSDSWEARLNTGLERARSLQIQTTESMDNSLTKPTDLADEEVTLPIAAVWEGLRSFGISCAYGTTDCFRFNRSPDKLNRDMTVVLQPSPLIMPLLFTDEYPTGQRRTKGLEHIGHLMLAVAERVPETTDGVKLIFIDSLPHRYGREAQLAAAQNLVRYSGWMGVDSQGHPVPTNPTFTEEWRPSPRQECGNTCGFYLIMNAWAYMLAIPISGSPFRRNRTGQRSAKNFLATGLEIINLAMAGCMDSRTIQSYLNHYGYSVEQDLDDATLLAAGAIPTMRVSVESLQGIVQDLRMAGMINALTAGVLCQCPEQ